MLLADISAAHINTAIQIYLDHAYEADSLRAAHAVSFPVDLPIEGILQGFEKEQDTKLNAYSLRLGCQHYPHLKLSLHEAYYRDEYIFAVDRHDGFDFEKSGPDYEQWLGIKSKNHRIKGWIEEAWYAAGIPTLRQLKETCLTLSAIIREFSGHVVLLVDDDQDGGMILKMCLEQEGYECLWASGVREALEILESPGQHRRIGLALVDLMLGDGSGNEVIRAIRSKARTQEIPIILTSAMNQSDIYELNIDVYLRKPFALEDCLATVANTIRQRHDGSDCLVEKKK